MWMRRLLACIRIGRIGPCEQRTLRVQVINMFRSLYIIYAFNHGSAITTIWPDRLATSSLVSGNRAAAKLGFANWKCTKTNISQCNDFLNLNGEKHIKWWMLAVPHCSMTHVKSSLDFARDNNADKYSFIMCIICFKHAMLRDSRRPRMLGAHCVNVLRF